MMNNNKNNTNYGYNSYNASSSLSHNNQNQTNSLAESYQSLNSEGSSLDISVSSRGMQQKYFEAFKAYLTHGHDPRGRRRDENDDPNSGRPRQGQIRNFTLEELKAIGKTASGEEKRKQLENEIEQRKSNIRRMQEATEKFKVEQEAERESLKKKGKKIEKKYEQVKSEIENLSTECGQMKESYENVVGSYAFFGPMIAKLGVDIKKMSCREGKPIDPSGEGGTCSVWNCPLVDNQENPDFNPGQ